MLHVRDLITGWLNELQATISKIELSCSIYYTLKIKCSESSFAFVSNLSAGLLLFPLNLTSKFELNLLNNFIALVVF